MSTVWTAIAEFKNILNNIVFEFNRDPEVTSLNERIQQLNTDVVQLRDLNIDHDPEFNRQHSELTERIKSITLRIVESQSTNYQLPKMTRVSTGVGSGRGKSKLQISEERLVIWFLFMMQNLLFQFQNIFSWILSPLRLRGDFSDFTASPHFTQTPPPILYFWKTICISSQKVQKLLLPIFSANLPPNPFSTYNPFSML